MKKRRALGLGAWLFAALIFAGCQIKEPDNTPNLYKLRKLPVGSSARVDVSTGIGHNQVVHPDIVVYKKKFYLVVTPYPWCNDGYENPSIYVSEDGVHFRAAAKNPLVDPPKDGYNADPDLLVDRKLGIFRIYFVQTADSFGWHKLSMLQSHEAKKWYGPLELLRMRPKKGGPFLVSPALVKRHGRYHLFAVDIDSNRTTHSVHLCTKDPYRHRLVHLVSKDGRRWDLQKAKSVEIDFPKWFNPWHINIVEGDGRYYMLVDGYKGGICDDHNLYLAVSEDLECWHFIPQPVVTPDDGVIPHTKIIYRSAALVDGEDMWIYFSAYTYSNFWYLGLKHIRIGDYVR